MLSFLQQHGVKQIDPLIYIEHENIYHDNGMGSVEVAIPVNSSSVGSIVELSGGRITVRELPGVNTMACLLYHGSPNVMMEAYQALGTWIQVHEYIMSGPCRKVCLRREGEPDSYITELQFPVEKSENGVIAGKRFSFALNGGRASGESALERG
jgi:effector-binding domain-containing protein